MAKIDPGGYMLWQRSPSCLRFNHLIELKRQDHKYKCSFIQCYASMKRNIVEQLATELFFILKHNFISFDRSSCSRPLTTFLHNLLTLWPILIEADECWLMLINAAWCWLMFINAQMRFNRVFYCQSVPPELLRSFLNKGTDKLILEVLVFCLLACFPLTWSFDQWSLVIGQTVRCLIWGWSVGSWLTELHPFRKNMVSTLYELVWIGLNQFV